MRQQPPPSGGGVVGQYTHWSLCRTYHKHARVAGATIAWVSTSQDPPPHKHSYRVKLALLTKTAEVLTSLNVWGRGDTAVNKQANVQTWWLLWLSGWISETISERHFCWCTSGLELLLGDMLACKSSMQHCKETLNLCLHCWLWLIITLRNLGLGALPNHQVQVLTLCWHSYNQA